MTVLDIGCGWGGMGLELAGRYGADVAGVTLSKEQLAIAQSRAKAANLDQRARFRRPGGGPSTQLLPIRAHRSHSEPCSMTRPPSI